MRSAFFVVTLALASCNANDVLLYGPAAAGAGDVTAEGMGGGTNTNETGGTGGTDTTGTGGTDASGGTGATGTGGADASGGSSATGGTGNDAGSDGTEPQMTCTSNGDCSSDSWYCSKPSCSAAEGICLPRPEDVDATSNPVCGCDHVTYLNTYVRQSFGVSADTPRECSDQGAQPPCMSDEDCGGELVCAHLFPRPGEMNCSYRGGTCWGLPPDCEGSNLDARHWTPCGPPAMGTPTCVSMCTAIQSHGLYVPAPPDVCPP